MNTIRNEKREAQCCSSWLHEEEGEESRTGRKNSVSISDFELEETRVKEEKRKWNEESAWISRREEGKDQ